MPKKYKVERLDNESLLCIYSNIEIADADFEERTEQGQLIIDQYIQNGKEHIIWNCPIK